MKNTVIKFSVIIPCHNSSNTISHTLDSLSRQKIPPFEVIVIDDNSSDVKELERIIFLYSNELNLRFIKSNVKLYGSGARNKGIELATGDFVCFLDSDDIWLDDKLSVLQNVVKRYDFSANVIFYSALYFGDLNLPYDDCMVYPERGISLDENVGEYLFLHGGLMQTSTICCSLSIAKDIMFDERFVRHQDFDFVLRAASKGYSFFFIEKPLVKWVQYDSSNVTKKGESPKFCYFWFSECKNLLSADAQQAYKLFYLARRELSVNQYKAFFTTIYSVIFLSSIRFKFKLMKRLYDLLLLKLRRLLQGKS